MRLSISSSRVRFATARSDLEAWTKTHKDLTMSYPIITDYKAFKIYEYEWGFSRFQVCYKDGTPYSQLCATREDAQRIVDAIGT